MSDEPSDLATGTAALAEAIKKRLSAGAYKPVFSSAYGNRISEVALARKEIYEHRQRLLYEAAPAEVRAFIDRVRALRFDLLPFRADVTVEIEEAFAVSLPAADAVISTGSCVRMAVRFSSQPRDSIEMRGDATLTMEKGFRFAEIIAAKPGFFDGAVAGEIARLSAEYVLRIIGAKEPG